MTIVWSILTFIQEWKSWKWDQTSDSTDIHCRRILAYCGFRWFCSPTQLAPDPNDLRVKSTNPQIWRSEGSGVRGQRPKFSQFRLLLIILSGSWLDLQLIQSYSRFKAFLTYCLQKLQLYMHCLHKSDWDFWSHEKYSWVNLRLNLCFPLQPLLVPSWTTCSPLPSVL